jgi:hypothetical protein
LNIAIDHVTCVYITVGHVAGIDIIIGICTDAGIKIIVVEGLCTTVHIIVCVRAVAVAGINVVVCVRAGAINSGIIDIGAGTRRSTIGINSAGTCRCAVSIYQGT